MRPFVACYCGPSPEPPSLLVSKIKSHLVLGYLVVLDRYRPSYPYSLGESQFNIEFAILVRLYFNESRLRRH